MRTISNIKELTLPDAGHLVGVFILLFMALSLRVFSQSLSVKLIANVNDTINEEMYLITDRDLYIAGEVIYIKVYCFDKLTRKESVNSKVAYISLLDHASAPIAQCKVWLDGLSGSGWLLIPDTLRTGKYLINSCTTWIRNSSPDRFTGKIITIVNPFISIEHIKRPTPQDSNLKKSSISAFKEDATSHEREALPGFALLNITSDKVVIHPRDKTRINLIARNRLGEPAPGDFVVSVIKSFTYDEMNHYKSDSSAGKITPEIDRHPMMIPRNERLFLPEPEGHLVSGTVFSTITGEPITREIMVLSFIGKTSLCRFDRTDDNGAFRFIINESGKQDLVIQPLDNDLIDIYIELDNPFPDVFASYDPGQYFIDTACIEELNDAVISMQVQDLYRHYRDSLYPTTLTELKHDFYGDPSYTILLSDFIELSSVKEVFKELLPVVDIKTRRGVSRFTLSNSSPTGYPLLAPFVMVDGVPVNDHDAILKLNPADLEKINIVNCRYFISYVSLEGIIDLKTIKGNLSSTGLSRPMFRQEFDAPLSGSDFYSPVYDTEEKKNNRIPDFRNTLFWNPDLRTGRNGEANLDFYASDEPGDYLVIVEGFTSEGRFVRAAISITVRLE